MSNTDQKGIANVPTTPPPLTPTWVPTRKVLAGGIGGILAWALFAGISAWFHVDPAAFLQPYVTAIAAAAGISPAPSAQGGVAIVLGWGIAYIIPTAYKDIERRWNDRVIAFAAKSPSATNVSISGILSEAGRPPAPPGSTK